MKVILLLMCFRCSWEGKDCSALNFTSAVTDFGLCHTFNGGHLPLMGSNTGMCSANTSDNGKWLFTEHRVLQNTEYYRVCHVKDEVGIWPRIKIIPCIFQ